MTSLALTPNAMPDVPMGRTARALRSLMSLFERGEAEADLDQEEDLMVMLSGMVPMPAIDDEE